MNRLQNIDPKIPLFASLNPWTPPATDLVLGRYEYEHPVFSRDTVSAQQSLAMIQGARNTWYCGAYCGFGFHEDGLKSGIRVARSLGVEPPWSAVDCDAFAQSETVSA
jgi:predicted NAD/FAD-binding protein